MTPSARNALHTIADEIANLTPVPSTFKGLRDPVAGAKITLRMVVELIRERANGTDDTSQPADPKHIAEIGLQ